MKAKVPKEEPAKVTDSAASSVAPKMVTCPPAVSSPAVVCPEVTKCNSADKLIFPSMLLIVVSVVWVVVNVCGV